MINYLYILQVNYAEKQWAITGTEYDTIQWFDTSPKPSQEEMDALWGSTQETMAKEKCKKQASALLYETDWTAIPDVANPSDSSPYLTNQREFMTWRSEIRQLAVNPVVAPVWPTQPTPTWGNKA
jgi:hypothetical protein